jgi:hypothetical protein
MKTYAEQEKEILSIIDDNHWVDDRLSALRSAGYKLEYCWVKNGGVGTTFYMRNKRVYRVQVASSEAKGRYSCAWCVVLPAEQHFKTSQKKTPQNRTLEQVC